MQKILAIAWTDLRIFLSDRANLVGLLLIPSVMTIVLGLAQGGGGGTPTIDIVVNDQDESAQSTAFIEELDDLPTFDVFLTTNPIDDSRQDVVNGRYDALIVIPQGFEQSIANFTPIEITFYSNEAVTSPSVIQPAIDAIIGQWNGSLVAARVGESVAEQIGADVDTQDLYDRAEAILLQEPVSISYTLSAVEESDVTGFNQSVPGMGSMFVMFTILGGMAVLVRERQQWTIQRLIVMPVSRSEVIAGKILAYFTLGMLQYAVVFAIGLIFGMDFGNSLLGLLLIAMAFSLTATALTFAIATRLKSEGQASQLTTLLALSLAALGGAWWPLEVVPDFMRMVGHISPIAWAMDGFHDLLFRNGTLIDVLPEVGILLVISAGLFVLGVSGFKYDV